MTIHRPTAAVRDSFSQAQQQAAAFVAGPPPAWDAATQAQRRSPLWIGMAATSIAMAGVAGWFGIDWLNGARPASATAASGAPAAPSEPLRAPPSPAVRTQATPAAPSIAPAMAPMPAPPSVDVTRQAGVIRIESTNASLAETVRALALATHTSVKGGEALASIAIPITLRWQGTDTPAAWDALLGRFASTAISCGSAGCELWVVSVNAPRAVASTAANGSNGVVTQAVPAPVVVMPLPPPPPPPQNNEENTETN